MRNFRELNVWKDLEFLTLEKAQPVIQNIQKRQRGIASLIKYIKSNH
jgi:hypothetical protein